MECSKHCHKSSKKRKKNHQRKRILTNMTVNEDKTGDFQLTDYLQTLFTPKVNMIVEENPINPDKYNGTNKIFVANKKFILELDFEECML
jgi:hypothetical protein